MLVKRNVGRVPALLFATHGVMFLSVMTFLSLLLMLLYGKGTGATMYAEVEPHLQLFSRTVTVKQDYWGSLN